MNKLLRIIFFALIVLVSICGGLAYEVFHEANVYHIDYCYDNVKVKVDTDWNIEAYKIKGCELIGDTWDCSCNRQAYDVKILYLQDKYGSLDFVVEYTVQQNPGKGNDALYKRTINVDNKQIGFDKIDLNQRNVEENSTFGWIVVAFFGVLGIVVTLVGGYFIWTLWKKELED